MKLKNKRTGEIGELQIAEKHCAVSVGNGTASCGIEIYSSLNGLNEEWEDVPEEPKTHWMIDTSILEPVREIVGQPYEIDREIGNWFNTKEEAELAIRKLKAWKRLKDKGFRFILDGETEMPMFVYSGANGEKCITSAEESKQCRNDIKLLFGGEE